MELFFEILLAVFSVFGLWCALHLAAGSLLYSRCVGTVIIVRDAAAAADLEHTLAEVRYGPGLGPGYRRGAPLAVLYSADLCRARGLPPPAEQAMIARAGGQWYAVEMGE